MLNSENSLPVSTRISVHKLEGKALRQWWQIPQLWRAEKPHTNQSPALRTLFHFLIVLPIFAILPLLTKAVSGTEFAKLMLLAGAAYLGGALLFISCVRRHLYHVLQVRVTEVGLELSSLFFKRQVRWLDIADFFPAGNSQVGHTEYVIDCRSGEQFFLSRDLSESAKLFDLIANRVPPPTMSYETTYYVGDGLFDMPFVACFAVFVAVLFGAGRWLLTVSHPAVHDIFNHAVIPALISALPLSCWWLHANKVPQLIRAGRSAIYVRTRSKGTVIPLDQISKITQVGWWLIVKSRSGWFLMLAPKNEPMTTTLLECKKNLLLLDRKSS